MIVIGVRFKKAGKIYYFDPTGNEFQFGDGVIVETVRGVEYGTVALANREVSDDEIISPVKKIIRPATERDREIVEENIEKAKKAKITCQKCADDHGLGMKVTDVEMTFDMNKIIFFFTADGRIDFRDLVKDLAAIFKTRIELRQIGVRDEAKMLNGIGVCGRTLCCATFLGDFHPVSIKMAKDQGLSLNPTKISGICGRLMCCLKYEQDTYEYLIKNLPHEGDIISTDYGKGEVLSVNVLRRLIKAAIDTGDNEKEVMFLDPSEIKVLKSRHTKEEHISKEDLKKLMDD
ncbi:MAG: stage 0 sporulation family protein [Firmicutes bacterium]|nr:stage 0 sporulation family protein [Bacillota bacterium]